MKKKLYIENIFLFYYFKCATTCSTSNHVFDDNACTVFFLIKERMHDAYNNNNKHLNILNLIQSLYQNSRMASSILFNRTKAFPLLLLVY